MKSGVNLWRSVVIVLVVAALAGCQPAPKPVKRVRSPELPQALPLVRPASADRKSLPATVRANNAFALVLYHHLRVRPGNVLMSPACVSAGLALVRAGARGETARQIARVLHLPNDLADADRAYAALIQDLSADAEDRSHQIRLASAIWVEDGYPLLESFESTLKEVFAVDAGRVDFSGNRDEACRVINTWTASRTGGKIAGLLQAADLPPHTRLIVTSALYLQASWRQRFRREYTRSAPFHLASGRSVDVPMMNDHSYSVIHGYYDAGSFQALELPCGSRGEFAVVVLLPRKIDGLADLEAALTPEALDSWWPKFRRPEEIIIALPKYRIRANVTLNKLLSGLGMPLAFGTKADFSGINGKSHDLFVSGARHATYLDVHEEGIEAAAAMDVISPESFGEEPPIFRADHPFVFLIRDTRSGCIVFLGRVANPLEPSFEIP